MARRRSGGAGGGPLGREPEIGENPIVEQVLAQHPAAVQGWQKGKRQSLGFLVGQVMKATGGKANPALVNQLLLEKLPKS